jgi:putative acetyltransferase
MGKADGPYLHCETSRDGATLASRYPSLPQPGIFHVPYIAVFLNFRPDVTSGFQILRIELDDLSRPAVLALLEEHVRNMYELSPPEQVFAFDASKLKAPEISFWTAWKGETLIGCAALKQLSATEGEIKSMRTPSKLRRTGAGRALLNHILEVAGARSYRVLYLETGRHPAFRPAQTLYGSVGFKPCGPFGTYCENGNSIFMALRLP